MSTDLHVIKSRESEYLTNWNEDLFDYFEGKESETISYYIDFDQFMDMWEDFTADVEQGTFYEYKMWKIADGTYIKYPKKKGTAQELLEQFTDIAEELLKSMKENDETNIKYAAIDLEVW